MNVIQKWLLGLSTLGLVLSGGVYALLKYLGEPLSRRFPSLFPAADDAFSAVGHPIQPWALDLHILAAPVLVFTIGWIFRDHILTKLANKGAPQRATGIVSVAVLLPMILSGPLLQTVTHERRHLAVVLVHSASGLLFALAYAAHVLSSSRRTTGDVVPAATTPVEPAGPARGLSPRAAASRRTARETEPNTLMR